jgi:hypothetical protein
MKTVETSLASHVSQILQAVVDILEGELAEGKDLEEVNAVIRGDRARTGRVKPPVLWVFPGIDTIETSGGQANIHSFEVIVAALVESIDPDKGHAGATDLAARAYDILMADRTWNNTVHDVKPVRFDPSFERAKGPNIYWAAAVLQGRVRRRD